MKEDNISYNEEHTSNRVPDDGLEEIEIEPINWNDI